MRKLCYSILIGIIAVALCISAADAQTLGPSPFTPSKATANLSARTLATFGDSLTYLGDTGNLTNGACGASTTSCIAQLPSSYNTWINLYTGYRAYRQPGYDCGLNGATTTTLLPQVSCVLNLNPDIVVMQIGANDAAGAVSCATITTNNRSMYQTFLNAGIAVIKVGIYPRSGGSTFSTTAANIAQCANQRDREYARSTGVRGFYFVDVEGVAVDPTQTGSWASPSGFLSDGAHPAQTGASQISALIANVINALVPPWRVPNYSAGDVYDATNNPGGNLLTNGLLTGSGGGVSSCTGSSPTSTSLAAGGLGGSACVGAVGTTVDSRPFMSVTLSGAATGSNLNVIWFQEANSLSNFSVGDTIYATGCIAIATNSGLSDAQIILKTTESGTDYNYQAAQGSGSAFPVNGWAMSGGGCGPGYVFQITPPRTLTVIPTKVEIDVKVDFVSPASATTMSGTIYVSSLAIRKVIN